MFGEKLSAELDFSLGEILHLEVFRGRNSPWGVLRENISIAWTVFFGKKFSWKGDFWQDLKNDHELNNKKSSFK